MPKRYCKQTGKLIGTFKLFWPVYKLRQTPP